MKYVHKILIPSLLLLLFTAACDTDELHDLNVDPNSVAQIDLNYFLTAAELGSASAGSSGDNRYTDWRTNIGMGAHVVQQFATTGSGGSLGASGDKYFENDAEQSNAPFQFFTRDVGRTTAEIIRQTGEGGYAEGRFPNTRQAARILRVLNYHRLTDFYGSIPYFEANQGLEGVFNPAYDKQSVIYADLLKELDEATSGFVSEDDVDQPGFVKADFIYGGSTAQWKKFGFSLMLRLAMRISNVDGAKAAEYVTKAAAGGVFTSNDDNVWVTMSDGPSEWTNQNGISRAMDPGDGGQSKNSFLAKTFIDFLKGANAGSTADDDPRLMIFSGGIGEWKGGTDFVAVAGGLDPLNQEGMPNGLDQGGIDVLNGGPTIIRETYSSANYRMFQDSDPYILMHYAEVELLLAEAVERGIGSGISGTAKEHYEKGVKAAMQMWTPMDASFTVSDAAVTTYLAAHPYGVEKPALEMIGEQMWASKFLNWWDAWSDQRRTGFPDLVPTNFIGNDTGGTIPQKLLLPAREATINPNYATGATLPDRFTTKVWWAGGTD
jgi:hypothetical protein